MTISEQIKVLCVRCGVSEAELARRLGKSPREFDTSKRKKCLSALVIIAVSLSNFSF